VSGNSVELEDCCEGSLEGESKGGMRDFALAKVAINLERR
jgi:hypothetical protein